MLSSDTWWLCALFAVSVAVGLALELLYKKRRITAWSYAIAFAIVAILTGEVALLGIMTAVAGGPGWVLREPGTFALIMIGTILGCLLLTPLGLAFADATSFKGRLRAELRHAFAAWRTTRAKSDGSFRE